MSDGQNKTNGSTPGDQQQPQQPAQIVYNMQQPGASYPYAPAPIHSFYAYPPPPAMDPNGHPADPNVPNGVPAGAYMMAFPPPPPGVIYAYPPGQGYPGMPFPTGMPLPAALVRPKRKQVKMACTNCAAACKRCDEARPCERCSKYGIADTCQDGVRKERKKGIKRGPYKRKSKINPEQTYEASFPPEGNPPAEWHAGAGFYPYFYPPTGFVPLGPDGQPLQPDPNAAGQAAAAMQPHPQYYPLHPAAYTPFPYPHAAPGAYPGMMPGQVPMHQAMGSMAGPSAVPDANNMPMDPSKVAGSSKDVVPRSDESAGDASTRKKRGRSDNTAEGSPREKKARAKATASAKKAGKKLANEADNSTDMENGEHIAEASVAPVM